MRTGLLFILLTFLRVSPCFASDSIHSSLEDRVSALESAILSLQNQVKHQSSWTCSILCGLNPSKDFGYEPTPNVATGSDPAQLITLLTKKCTLKKLFPVYVGKWKQQGFLGEEESLGTSPVSIQNSCRKL